MKKSTKYEELIKSPWDMRRYGNIIDDENSTYRDCNNRLHAVRQTLYEFDGSYYKLRMQDGDIIAFFRIPTLRDRLREEL